MTEAHLPRMAPEDVYAAIQAGDALLYGVRPAQAYALSRAEGAVSLPESEAVARLGSLPGDGLLVLY